MDRFSSSLLVAMAIVLVVGLGVIFFSKDHKSMPTADPAVNVAKVEPTPPKTDQRLLFSGTDTSGSAVLPGAMPVTTALPMTALPVTALPAAPQTMAAPAVAMPTPLPWSPPNYGRVVTVGYPGYNVVYSETLGNPVAVQYAMVGGAKPKRYPPPNLVVTPRGQLIDAAGYRRGEMALEPSISLYFGKSSGKNTSLMTNICAFNPPLLAGLWSQFAAMEKRYAGAYGWIEIVAGPIFANPPTRAANGLIVPDAFFRAYRRSYGDAMAFIIPQMATSTNLADYLTSVSTIEAATGITLFGNNLTPEQKAQTAGDIW